MLGQKRSIDVQHLSSYDLQLGGRAGLGRRSVLWLEWAERAAHSSPLSLTSRHIMCSTICTQGSSDVCPSTHKLQLHVLVSALGRRAAFGIGRSFFRSISHPFTSFQAVGLAISQLHIARERLCFTLHSYPEACVSCIINPGLDQ